MRIGILGGGQLARMLALAGYELGLKFVFYDPSDDCCAKELGFTLHADYADQKKLTEFISQVDVVTFENENIPLSCAEFIERQKPLYPSKEILRFSQDRLHEKTLFNQLKIPTVKFIEVNHARELELAAVELGFPFIVKTRRHGYDGKGQFRIHNQQELTQLQLPINPDGYIAEQWVDFSREVSIIAIRSVSGQLAFYDLAENQHKHGILDITQNRINDPLFESAKEYSLKILEKFDYVGTLVIEFFAVNNQLVANEMAPRVHNSGHWTIEGAATSQFENHLRAILDWPLGATHSRGYVLMKNLIGHIPDKKALLAVKNLHLHDYAKAAKSGRKLGHVTIVHDQPLSKKDLAQIAWVGH